ncbi:MAG: hypothetical protein LWW94_09610 [Candidatus Desulfofervidaceae bacterium]|nr:hypothetical protein [Candidatus Desulfofervidaceae bacterium]
MDFKKVCSVLFLNLLSQEDISQKFDVLPPNKKLLFQGIFHRRTFDSYLECKLEHSLPQILKELDMKFIRSLQGYLLLSCGDALGTGGSYYSFQDFLKERNNPEREQFLKQFANKINSENFLNIVEKLIKVYEQRQSVKQSFFNFWNRRSVIIKQKLLFCYKPFSSSGIHFSDKEFHQLIKKRLYETYRNPFTHKAQSNFPQPPSETAYSIDPSMGKAIKWLEFHRIDGKIFQFKVPLSIEEAEKILTMEGSYYFRLGNENFIPYPENLNSPNELVGISITFREGIPGEDEREYIHPGILEVLRMAIAEGCAELIGLKINWLNQINKIY